MSENRRDFLRKGALLGLAGLSKGLLGEEKIRVLESFSQDALSSTDKFVLPTLPYAYDALEPFIDKQTMEIHHTKHHQAYITKLNEQPANTFDFKLSDDAKCMKIDKNSAPVVRNNLGGYYNHSLFWTLLKPNPEGKPNIPEGKIAKEIDAQFKSFDNFKKEFSDKSVKIFGSGWCWLIKDKDGKLKIVTTPNQDNPLMKIDGEQGKPLLALDVWEHAYYLKYQNKRVDYVNNWWNLVNWKKAEELFT